jgi:iron(III) transport system permease protein
MLTLVPVVYLVVRRARAGRTSSTSCAGSGRWTSSATRWSWPPGQCGSILVGVPMAWLIERTDLPGRRLIATLAPLPLAVPSYVGALTFIAALGPQGLLKDVVAGTLGVESIPAIYASPGRP